jgi:DNA-binding GntR family transcriptional regulator
VLRTVRAGVRHNAVMGPNRAGIISDVATGDPSAGGKQRGPLRLSDVAADHIRELIVSGQLPAGQFIRPETVAEELGISATPVREGLLQLQTDGFVTIAPRRGWSVSALSQERHL